jgi:hypothetical protein
MKPLCEYKASWKFIDYCLYERNRRFGHRDTYTLKKISVKNRISDISDTNQEGKENQQLSATIGS